MLFFSIITNDLKKGGNFMKIGIIGLGDIAQKAYLPIISAKENLELVLCSRNTTTLKNVSNKYRIPCCVHSIDELMDTGVDAAFVHTSTEVHVEIVEKLLLNGINVYVDKPIAYSYDEALRLENLSHRTKKILMVGFNRRFAPMYRKLKEHGNADLIIMQKNRISHPGNAREIIFDDFILVVDTLRYLMDCPITDIKVSSNQRDNKLYNIVLQLFSETCSSIGLMNRDSGASEEIVEYMVPGKKIIVKDLVSTVSIEENSENLLKFKDWDTTLYKRGFYSIVEHFINCVEHNLKPNPSIQDSLITHKICERIVKDLAK
jgi:virulence factor